MKKITLGRYNLLFNKNISDEAAVNLFESVKGQKYQIRSILKENHRSTVSRITIEGHDLVLKVPREKNTRKWIRFLTWFRKGEAFKNLMGMERLLEADIPTTKPVLAAEKRSLGMVTYSWLLYDHLEGESCLDRENHYPAVVELLRKMHTKGLLHGDSQIRNFISKNGIIHVIDSNPAAVGLTGFNKAFEFAYLRRSAPGIEKYFGEMKDDWLYKLAISYDKFDRKLARSRRKLKKDVSSFFKSSEE